MATATATERAAIEEVIKLYVEGSSAGQVAKLQQAFHPDARMFGSLAGQRYDIPITELFEMAAAQPLGSPSYEARVTSIEQIGDAATATLEEDGCWGSVSFVNWFQLAKIDGEWRIVNKLFAHTGGELPTG